MKKLLLLMFLASNIFALNRGEILEQVRYGIKDTENTTNSLRWSDDILNKRIDIVQKQIDNDTLCIYKETTTDVVANQQEYSMPSDCYKIDRIAFLSASSTTFTNQYKKLTAFTLPGLDISDNVLWENLSAGLPTKYYEKGNSFGLVPKPSSVYSSTGGIKVDYYAVSDSLTSDSSIPWNGYYNLYGWHYLIIEGVKIMCLQDEGYDMTQKKQEYYALVQKMAADIKNKPDQRSGAMNVNYK